MGSKDIIASVMYTVVTPMLNPFIYSLRNRDIKQALEIRQKSSMRPENQSSVSQFLLWAPIPPGQQDVFFTLFLGMYLTTAGLRLHTPMYFFLSHLAFSDISLSSAIVPKMLMYMQTQQKSISHMGCIFQLYFFIHFAGLDNFLLAVMAYDRYVAICHPLHYTIIMREGLCVLLVAGSWIISCAHDLLHTLLLVRLSFGADNIISHFFCDLAALLKLSCSDISLNELVLFAEGGMIFFLPFGVILGSYIRIGTIILRVPSTKRLFKAFSTCGSHLSVVFLYYGTAAGVYLFSSSWGSKDIIASVMYTVVTPMLNPFIYSLRNRDIKQALEMCVNRIKFLNWKSLNFLATVRRTGGRPTYLWSPPVPSVPQPPSASLRLRQASDGGCPAAQGHPRL
ncbi:hypothetical protein QTO34_005208, partial [Cnephaeus nilssonii]